MRFWLIYEVYNSKTHSRMGHKTFIIEAFIHPWKIISFDIHYVPWFKKRAPMPTSLTFLKLMDHDNKLIMIGVIGGFNITMEIVMLRPSETIYMSIK